MSTYADPYIMSCLHFDGNFNDVSGKIWTVQNGAVISTTQNKFGGSSLYLNGTNQCLTTPNSSDFDFGANNFTIDWWEYRTTIAGNGAVYTRQPNPSAYPMAIGVASGSNIVYDLSSSDSSWDIVAGETMGTAILNAWTHYALVRLGNYFYAFQNGILQSTLTSSASIGSATGTPTIGAVGTGSSFVQQFQGYIDEFRISKGIAKWTSNFTPPPAPYSPLNIDISALGNMKVGDVIPCNYTALAGTIGTFSQLGASSAAMITPASTANPNGTFNFIMVGYDNAGNKKLIADRVIQSSISWDTLNSAGIASGSGIPVTIDGNSSSYTIRLLGGGIGISSTDINDEWDQIIADYTLNLIGSGDNAMWNWGNIYSWCSTTTTDADTNRAARGYTAANGFTDYISSTVSNTLGFRPVLIVPTLSNVFLFLDVNGNVYGMT